MFARLARLVAAVVAVGLLVGGLIGGVGGRLAMRILAVTSDDSLRGKVTDDDEVVGRITAGGTIGLIIFLAFGGVIIAFAYVALRRWLPQQKRWRAGAMAALFWGIQGSTMFHPGRFDFTALEPHWLAVGMFSLILLGVGWFTAVMVDAAVARWPEPSRRTVPAYLPLVPLVVIFPIAVPILLGGLVAWTIQRYDGVRRVWESQAVTVLGGALLVAIGIYFASLTSSRVADILA
jgi:hypothetical protein